MKDIEKNVHTMDLKELIKEETFDFTLAPVVRVAVAMERHCVFPPILIGKNNEVIDGKKRLAVAQCLGWETVPVVNFDDNNLTKSQLEVLSHTDAALETMGLQSDLDVYKQ